jgi:UDP-N-acetylglucosamine:LPS N-acetylglucosamine transferase
VLGQEDMTPESLYDAILDAWAKRGEMKDAMEKAENSDGTTAVLEEIEKAAR